MVKYILFSNTVYEIFGDYRSSEKSEKKEKFTFFSQGKSSSIISHLWQYLPFIPNSLTKTMAITLDE